MKILILNSACGKYPVGGEPWIQATAEAVRVLAGGSVTVICSTEPSPWDITTYLVGLHRISAKLILKTHDNDTGLSEFSRIIDQYNLDNALTTPLFIGAPTGKKLTAKKMWQARDRAAVEEADIIFPVSLRPDGRLAHVLADAVIKKRVCDDFRIDWSARDRFVPHYDFGNRAINPLPEGDWLVHWTRASQGPWPGEKACEFYSDLFENPSVYVRNAEETLVRIFSEKKIRGSSWKIRGGERAVSFTTLPLNETLPLMRWRKRFVRYTFEPYGIAVNLSVLIGGGARAVSYESGAVNDNDGGRLFYHAPGEKTDWTREREWRLRGDFALDAVGRNDIMSIVPDSMAEAVVRNRIDPDIRIHKIFLD